VVRGRASDKQKGPMRFHLTSNIFCPPLRKGKKKQITVSRTNSVALASQKGKERSRCAAVPPLFPFFCSASSCPWYKSCLFLGILSCMIVTFVLATGSTFANTGSVENLQREASRILRTQDSSDPKNEIPSKYLSFTFTGKLLCCPGGFLHGTTARCTMAACVGKRQGKDVYVPFCGLGHDDVALIQPDPLLVHSNT